MSEKPCYVFKAKGVHAEKSPKLDEDVNSASLEQRKRLFESLWQPLQSRINDEINATNAQVISEVLSFLSNAVSAEYRSKIPAGLLVTSVSPSIHLFEQLQAQVSADSNSVYLSINSADSPNLRTLLKNIIQRAVQQRPSENLDEEGVTINQSGQKLLPYDFEILHRWCELYHIQRIIIMLRNSEAFDILVLADLIHFLQLWIDRVPTLLLVDVGTSTSNLQNRLPAAAVRALEAQVFDATKTHKVLETVFKEACIESKLHFGPSLTNFLFQRSHDYTQSIESFVQSLKYGYMCHFYGNPASLFLDENLTLSNVSEDLFESIRHLPSFRVFAESLMDRKQGAEVRGLLESNDILFRAVQKGIQEAHDIAAWLIGAVGILQDLRKDSLVSDNTLFSGLYIKALSGELATSPLVRETLMEVRKLSPGVLFSLSSRIYDVLMTMPARDLAISPDDFHDIHEDLQHILTADGSMNVEEIKTTPKKRGKQNTANKTVSRELATSAVSHADIVSRFSDLLEVYFKTCLIPIKDIFLQEIVFCDSRLLLQNALAPKPRAAIERALTSPHDYLGCSCCENTEGPTSTQPCTAILYQLFMESGALVNVFDLWTAFNEIIGQQYKDEQLVMAMFFRALAELRYMGMLKPSRRRVDHLGKVLWKGI